MPTTYYAPTNTTSNTGPYTNTTLTPTANTTVTHENTATTTNYYYTSPDTASPTIPTSAAKPHTIPSTTTTTTSPTMVTPLSTTFLNCSNGGKNLDGVCICPDELTGETCSKSKKKITKTEFCYKVTIDNNFGVIIKNIWKLVVGTKLPLLLQDVVICKLKVHVV